MFEFVSQATHFRPWKSVSAPPSPEEDLNSQDRTPEEGNLFLLEGVLTIST